MTRDRVKVPAGHLVESFCRERLLYNNAPVRDFFQQVQLWEVKMEMDFEEEEDKDDECSEATFDMEEGEEEKLEYILCIIC